MKVAMGVLALRRDRRRRCCRSRASPTSSTTSSSRRSHDSRYYDELEPSDGADVVGLVAGTVLALARHRARLPAVGARPRARRGRAARAARRACTASSSHKWYFDELIDSLIVRPFAWFGRFARNMFERVVINGLLVGGTAGRGARGLGRRARGPVGLPALLRRAAARSASPALGLYFLISALSDDPPLDPALLRRSRSALARRAGAAQRSRRCGLLVGALVPLAYAVLMLFDFDTGAAGCSTSPTTSGSRRSASATRSASTG